MSSQEDTSWYIVNKSMLAIDKQKPISCLLENFSLKNTIPQRILSSTTLILFTGIIVEL